MFDPIKEKINRIYVTNDVTDIYEIMQELLYTDKTELKNQLAAIFFEWGNQFSMQSLERNNLEDVKKDLQLSIEKYKDALLLNNEFTDVHYKIGVNLFNLANIFEENIDLAINAIPHIQKAIESKAEIENSYNLLGEIYLLLASHNESNFDVYEDYLYKAFNAFKSSITLNNKNLDAILNNAYVSITLAQLSADNNDKSESIQLHKQGLNYYKTAIEVSPSHYNSRRLYITALVNLPLIIEDANEIEKTYQLIINQFEEIDNLFPEYLAEDDIIEYWPTTLVKLAKFKSKNKAIQLYRQSLRLFNEISEVNPTAGLYQEWAISYFEWAKIEPYNSEELHQLCNEKFKTACQIEEDYLIYALWASYLKEMAITSSNVEEANKYFQRAVEKLKISTNLNPEILEIYNDYGVLYSRWAQFKEGIEVEAAYHSAFHYFEKAILTNTSYKAEFLYNYATIIMNFIEESNPNDTENWFKKAFDLFEKSLQIDPSQKETYINYGNLLTNYIPHQPQRENKLYQLSSQQYLKAIEINPDFHMGYDSLAYNYMHVAETLSDKEKLGLQTQAISLFKKSINLGGAYYNLACLYARMNNVKDALVYLEQSLKDNEQTIEFILDDKDWKDMLNLSEFKHLIRQYS